MTTNLALWRLYKTKYRTLIPRKFLNLVGKKKSIEYCTVVISASCGLGHDVSRRISHGCLSGSPSVLSSSYSHRTYFNDTEKRFGVQCHLSGVINVPVTVRCLLLGNYSPGVKMYHFYIGMRVRELPQPQ